MKPPLRRSSIPFFAAIAFIAGPELVHAAVPMDRPALPSLAKSQQFAPPDTVPDGLAPSDWSGIRAAYDAGRHAFAPTATGWQARNPGQQWTTTFDQRGFLAVPQDGTWQWGLELQSYGFGENQHAVGGTPAVQVSGQRLSYQWDANVQEWFVNDQRGLEHGFIVSERPAVPPHAPPSDLAFLLATRGTLHPSLSPDAQGLLFQDAGGATVLTYTGLKVWDADGQVLAAHFEAAGQNRVRLVVDERAARYPITIDPIAQQAYLKGSNTEEDDRFGNSVAVSGDTVVVGAWYEDSSATGVDGNQSDNSVLSSGAAYVFVRSGTTWTQQAYLKASNTEYADYFGKSVAVADDTVVVGAWYEASNATGINGNQSDNSARWSGAAYVFVRTGTTWTQQAYLKASNTESGDEFGNSVAVWGDTVVVGARGEESNATGINGNQNNNSATNSGAAYVFVRSGTTWTQQAYLKASNTGEQDRFGTFGAMWGDTVVVGAWYEDSSATGVNGNQSNNSAPDSGAAYVFVRSGTTWTQQAYLKASNTGEEDLFGLSVAVWGDTVVVGAEYEASNATGINGNQSDNSAPWAGAAYVFVRTGTTWTQQAYLKASNTERADVFGNSVAVEGDTVVVGARYEDSSATGVDGNQSDNSVMNSGAAYVFVRTGTTWAQQAYLKGSNTGEGRWFGTSVAMSGDTMVVGGIGSPAYGGAGGAAFVFTGLGIPRPVITGSTVLSGGAFQLRFRAAAGATYLVERSTANLLDWTPLGAPTETLPGEFEFIDTEAPNHSTQFYRVR